MNWNRTAVNFLACFASVYVPYRLHRWLISPRYPQYNYKLYLGRNKRRVHHLEVGFYLVAIGLALILDDIGDRSLEEEFKQYVKDTISKETKS